MTAPDPSDEDTQRLRERRRSDREWRLFLDSAIHDLRTPLRGAHTTAELLSETCKDALTGDAPQLIQRMLEGLRRMDSLLRSLTEYSTVLEADSMAAVSVPTSGVVRSAIETLQPMIRDTGATIHYNSLPIVTGHWEQLSMLFRNLLANALRYRAAESPSITISAERNRDMWVFTVKDNGMGIDAQYWERVFVPFQRLQSGLNQGAGLGLAICKRIVELHGGRIWVESRMQAGSTFFFTIPYSE